jgi:DNA polymerase-1
VGPLKKLREQGYEPPLLNALFKRRKALRMVNTYTEKFKKLADCRSMIYPGYSLTSTDSGRVASFNPNAQNIPREPRVRRIIAAPPGKVLLAADYSQLEMRTAASKYVFDEPNLREAFLRGDDVHRLLAATITGKLPVDVTKVERTNAKPPNFLFLYGGEEQMYIDTLLDDYDIVKPFAEARRERDAYFTRWNQLPAGHAKYVDELLATGEVRSPLGTRRRIPHVFDLYPSARKEAFRVVINFVNQCFAAHLAQIGLVLLNAAGIDVRSFQHDAYLCYVDDNEEAVRSTARTMRDLLTRGVPQVLYDEFGLTLDVPLLVDVSAGTAWTDDDRLCEHDVWMPKLACPQCIEAAVWKHLDVGYTVAV